MDVENPKKKKERLQSEINKLDNEIEDYRKYTNEGENEFKKKMGDIKKYSTQAPQAELAGTQGSLDPVNSVIKDKRRIHKLTLLAEQEDKDDAK